MASTKLYFDTRSSRKDGKGLLKIGVNHKKAHCVINLNVLLSPNQWDEEDRKIINHPQKLVLNSYVSKKIADINIALLNLREKGYLDKLTGKELKEAINKELNPDDTEPQKPLFINQMKKVIDSKKNKRTKETYLATLKRIKDFTDIDQLTFEDITVKWLKEFDEFLSLTSPSQNARNFHHRNIRSVFNDALDDDIITNYPFRKFKLRDVETPKRSLQIDSLRKFRDYPCEPHREKYRDIFMLSFYLIGINIVDLCRLTHKSVVNGRIEYYRAKTGKFYSIKIEPEAMDLIEKYKGENFLINILDRYKDYRDFTKKLNYNLQQIGEVRFVEKNIKGKKRKIKERTPLFPNLSSYWARHSWATTAHKIGVPKDIISLALGHEFGQRITGIYIDYDLEKVDKANRKVLDYLKESPS